LYDPLFYKRLRIVSSAPPISDLSPPEAQKLVSSDITEPAERSQILLWLIAFPVWEEHKDRLRPIAWTKDLNDGIWSNFDPLDSISIPGIAEQKSQVLKGSRAATFDLTSGFHQLILAPEVRPFFGVQASDGSIYRYKRLPMGFTLSVLVLQSVLEALCESVEDTCSVSTLVYVDNIRIIADGRLGYAIATLLELCARFNFTLSSEASNSPHVLGDHMGIQYDYTTKQCRLSKKHHSRFCSFAKDLVGTASMSTAQAEILFGNLFWATEVLNIDTSAYFFALKWYSRRMSVFGSDSESCFSIWPSAKRDLLAWLGLVCSNVFVQISSVHTIGEYTLWSDASLSGFGSVLLHRSSGRISWHAGKWSATQKLQHINVLEMLALESAVLKFSHIIGSAPVLILIDNTSVKHVIRKKFSHSLMLNRALHKCASSLRQIAITEIRYIKSANNFADLPSRGLPPDLSAVDNFITHSASG